MPFHQSRSNFDAAPEAAIPMDGLSIGIVVLGSCGEPTIQICNTAFAEMLQIPIANLQGVAFATLVGESDQIHFRRALARVAQTHRFGPQLMQLLAPTSRDPDHQLCVEVTFGRFDRNDDSDRRIVLEIVEASAARRRQVDLLQLQQRLFQAEQSGRDAGNRARLAAITEVGHRLRTSLM